VTAAKASAMTTAELMRRLRRHYLPETEMLPGGILVPEVGGNASYVTNRRCDAIHVGFTSASGRILTGHELKVSRADWRHELDTLGKSDHWSDACHAWVVVAPSIDIVPVEEVPAGWGLMTPDPRSKRRFKTHVRPAIKQDHNPPWWAVRAVIARQDTLRANAERQRVKSAMDAAAEGIAQWVVEGVLPARTQYHEHWSSLSQSVKELAGRMARERHGMVDPHALAAAELIKAFEAEGVKLGTSSWEGDRRVTPKYLASVADLLMAHTEMEQLRARVTCGWVSLPEVETLVGKLRKQLDEIAQPAVQ